MDKAQNSTCTIVFILFADFPPALVGIKISYFVNYFFLYFSLNKDHKRWKHKKFHLKQRWDVAYTKSGTFPENLKTTSDPKNSMFVNFFWISEIGPKWWRDFISCAKFRHLSAVKNWAKTEHRAKSYARFTEGNSSYGFYSSQLSSSGDGS